jgi:hypothetical protein
VESAEEDYSLCSIKDRASADPGRKLAAVRYALKGATVEGSVCFAGPDGEIVLTALKIKTLDGHSLLLSETGTGFKIFRAGALGAAARSVFDWVRRPKGGRR